jgi:hypothetical protein
MAGAGMDGWRPGGGRAEGRREGGVLGGVVASIICTFLCLFRMDEEWFDNDTGNIAIEMEMR